MHEPNPSSITFHIYLNPLEAIRVKPEEASSNGTYCGVGVQLDVYGRWYYSARDPFLPYTGLIPRCILKAAHGSVIEFYTLEEKASYFTVGRYDYCNAFAFIERSELDPSALRLCVNGKDPGEVYMLFHGIIAAHAPLTEAWDDLRFAPANLHSDSADKLIQQTVEEFNRPKEPESKGCTVTRTESDGVKVSCDSCTAKFFLSKNIVDRNIAHIRCKKCGQVMTAVVPPLPTPAGTTPAPVDPSAPEAAPPEPSNLPPDSHQGDFC